MPSPEFSYDLYPGLDADLQAALDRNIATVNANPAEIATADLAAAVANTIAQPKPAGEWESAEAESWSTNELGVAQSNWLESPIRSKYFDGLESLIETKVATMNRLYNARQDLIASAGKTPAGESIGESMHLTLVPWKLMLDNIDRLPEWINSMRSRNGFTASDDFLGADLLSQIQDDAAIYRNPKAPKYYTTYNSSEPEMISTREYLAQRITLDGTWGVMLTQTNDVAGMSSLVNKCPDELTQHGSKHLEVSGQRVDGLGVLEFLAMTLQQYPAELFSNKMSWLLANRLDVNGYAQVPFGSCRGLGSHLDITYASERHENAWLSLAVI